MDNLPRILERTKERFIPAQIASLLLLMRRVANLEGHANEEQRKLIDATERYFGERRAKSARVWN